MSYLESLFSLNGRTALITGGTRGLGRAMTIALAQAGASIILVQRNLDDSETFDILNSLPAPAPSAPLQSSFKAEGKSSVVQGRKERTIDKIQCDLSDKSQVATLAERVLEQFGEVDILLNCGGINRRAKAELFTEEDWNEVLQINLHAIFTLTRTLGARMLLRRLSSPHEPNFKIINITSLLAYQGGKETVAYVAAKHGLLGLTRALACEWSGRGVNVNAISPGYITTEMTSAVSQDVERNRQILDRIPIGRWGTPGDFEGAVIFLASQASNYVCGEAIVVDGAWMAR